MSGIERGLGDERVRMDEIIRCRNVETGFIPEKWKPQQRCVQQENGDKDHRKDPSE